MARRQQKAAAPARHLRKRTDHRRRRPERPYDPKNSFRKAIWDFHAYAAVRGFRLHGPRCARVMLGLGERHPKVRSGVVYASTEQLGELGGQSDRSVQRAVPELEELGVIEVTRPNPCQGECTCKFKLRDGRCPGRGGKIFVEQPGGGYRPVGAATGYSLRKEWRQELAQRRRRARRAPDDVDEETAVPPGRASMAQVLEEQRAAQRGQQARDGPSP